jgi:excinuclease UvrABC ATPase subunit
VGINGGELCFEGLPEDITQKSDSFTGEYLKEKL